MQALNTKYLPPTNTLGSRIKVMGYGTSVTIPWNYSLDTRGNHEAAIGKMIERLNAEHRILKWVKVVIGNSYDMKGYTAIIDMEG